jgi:hypothetical protein
MAVLQLQNVFLRQGTDRTRRNRWLVWSAPAERSGDGAFVLSTRPLESGVALRLPPHSIVALLGLRGFGAGCIGFHCFH